MMKEQIGKRVREIRRTKKLTQKTLAQMAGVDYTYIGKIERAEQLPSFSVLIRIADSLSMPLDRFVMDESTFRLINLIPKEGYHLAQQEDLRQLFKLLEEIHEKDLSLIIEIIGVLKKHRGLKASENEKRCVGDDPPTPYRNSDNKRKISATSQT